MLKAAAPLFLVCTYIIKISAFAFLAQPTRHLSACDIVVHTPPTVRMHIATVREHCRP